MLSILPTGWIRVLWKALIRLQEGPSPPFGTDHMVTFCYRTEKESMANALEFPFGGI